MLTRLDTAHRSRRDRGESGASAVELAFIAPAFILLIFFTIQGSLFFYGRNVAIQAAREGVSQMRLSPYESDFATARPGVIAYTQRFAVATGRESLLDPVATPDYDNDAARVSMTVRGNVITLVPFMHFTVTETAEGSVERFQNLNSN